MPNSLAATLRVGVGGKWSTSISIIKNETSGDIALGVNSQLGEGVIKVAEGIIRN